jgi:hypothetical protein
MNVNSGQARCTSLLEAIVNVLIGYLLALVIQRLFFPIVGIRTTVAQEAQVAAVFTVCSVLRGYMLRRLFERLAGRRVAHGASLPSRRSEN